MDSRHINIPVPNVSNENILNEIFKLQKELISEYIKIEKGEKYPLNVNTRKSQSILKDFTSRVVEELAEGYESLTKVDEITRSNKFWANDYKSSDLTLAISHLQNANEEFADALHFIVELMVYINLGPEDVEGYLHKYYENIIDTPVLPGSLSLIEKAMAIGESNLLVKLSDDIVIPDINGMDNRNVIRLDKVYQDDETYSPETSIDINLILGGANYSVERYAHSYKEMLWDITYYLNLSRNLLRNKPWKQSQVFVDEQAYQEMVLFSFILLLGFFHIVGLNPRGVFYIYFKKNQINQFRIKSKY